jgi:hypothetical protein
MSNLADPTEHPPIVSQAEPPRVDVHVGLYAISHDLRRDRTTADPRRDPATGARLLGRGRGDAAADQIITRPGP